MFSSPTSDQITVLNKVAKFRWVIRDFTSSAGCGWITSGTFFSDSTPNTKWFLELNIRRDKAVLHIALLNTVSPSSGEAGEEIIQIKVICILCIKDFSFTVEEKGTVKAGSPLELTFVWEDNKWIEWLFEDAVIKCVVFSGDTLDS